MASSRDDERNHRALPPGRGPYDVGCGDIMTDVVAPGIFLRLFYPIDRTDRGIPLEERPPWLPSDHYAHGYADIGGVKRLGSRINKMLAKFTLPVWWHATLSDSKNKYPVVIFSHGLGGCRTTYTSICMDIASCGCVVAAVEHRDNSACHSFFAKNPSIYKTTTNGDPQLSQPKYQTVDFIKAPYEDPKRRLKQILQRRDECIAVLNFFEVLDDGLRYESDIDADFNLSQFKGRLDLSSAAICGHSFGGATAIATLSQDKRLKCGVACDPWGYPLSLKESFRRVDQPMLFINTEKFQSRDNMEHLLCFMPDSNIRTSVSRQMITIRGTNHQSQTDFGFVFPTFLARLLKMRDTLHPRVAIATNNDAMIDFLSRYISLEKGGEMAAFNVTEHPLIKMGHNVDMRAPWWQRIANKKNGGTNGQ